MQVLVVGIADKMSFLKTTSNTVPPGRKICFLFAEAINPRRYEPLKLTVEPSARLHVPCATREEAGLHQDYYIPSVHSLFGADHLRNFFFLLRSRIFHSELLNVC